MIRMQMTDDEIRGSFRRADDKKEIVKTLAELNAVKTPVMRDYLVQLGLIERRKSPVKVDDAKARELIAAGMTNEQVAEALGVGVNALAVWKRNNGLTVEQQRADGAAVFTLRKLSAVVAAVSQVFPEAEIRASGNIVRMVSVEIQVAADGEAVATVTMEG